VQDNKSREYFYPLDALRGLAAFAVAIAHFTTRNDYPLFKHGSIAVDFFFILSGFVVTHSYWGRLDGGMSPFDYFLRRLVRLYPMFIAGLLFGLVVFAYLPARYAPYSSKDILASLGYNALFLPSLNGGGSLFPANGVLWSLSLEMLASIVFLRLVWSRPKTLLAVVALSYVITLVYCIKLGVEGNGFQKFEILTNGGWGAANIWVGPPRVLYGFTFGMVLYKYRESLRAARLAAWFSRIRHQQTVLGMGLLLILAFPITLRGVYYFAIIGSVAPLIVTLGALATPATELSSDLARFLGWLSYPVYCLHFPVVLSMRALKDRLTFNGDSQLLPALEGFAITIVLAMILTKFYDEPVREYLSGKIRTYFQSIKGQACDVR
jgi:peptidoglycan/LPS O-acetylase OafA/YrhL